MCVVVCLCVSPASCQQGLDPARPCKVEDDEWIQFIVLPSYFSRGLFSLQFVRYRCAEKLCVLILYPELIFMNSTPNMVLLIILVESL